MTKTILMAAVMITVAGCTSVPRNTGTSYVCDRGTKLKVDYVGDGAIVRISGRQTAVLRQTSSSRGEIYENKVGVRLQRSGNTVIWNTAARSAPEQCRVVNTPL
ncbi:MliC family protein [Altererythrobacter sp. C41]|uniref:MliC family protein n=1 Tax=Altererythrobacter sp. C41 TaxID=2806021 RepID=UPI001931D96B|nr:MliC family protein [Altererythrobacter sp. C41]MBM0168821.1 MliC family protein [Altererythrobacter sp. C41]